MKKLLFINAVGLSVSLNAQVLTPKASPVAKLQQKVGLADIQIDYSRPGAKGRVIFGDLIPYGQMWRLGANENTKVTSSEALIFGKDTLKAGTYALFAKPGQTNWELYFYADYSNWGLPEPWDAKKVVLQVTQININQLNKFEINYSFSKLSNFAPITVILLTNSLA